LVSTLASRAPTAGSRIASTQSSGSVPPVLEPVSTAVVELPSVPVVGSLVVLADVPPLVLVFVLALVLVSPLDPSVSTCSSSPGLKQAVNNNTIAA
jgi:hypothetical protein